MRKTKGLYEPEFPVGTHVRIMEFEALEKFQQEWRWHNPLRDEQLSFAGRRAQVASVTFYHGGDELYELKGVPEIGAAHLCQHLFWFWRPGARTPPTLATGTMTPRCLETSS